MFGSGPIRRVRADLEPYTKIGRFADSFSWEGWTKKPRLPMAAGAFLQVRRRRSAPFRVHAVADQKPLTFRRPPVTVMPLSDAVGTALLRMALRICAAVAPLCVDAYSAAAPLTCGVAIEVPLYEP